MAKIFNIDNKQVVELTNKLEKMHRSALPVSVRGALNDAAFDMKLRTVEQEFKRNSFTIRVPKFVTSHTRVNKSPNTFNIRQMHSEAGIMKGKSVSGDQLEFQERGGVIKNRGAIPTDDVRISGSESKRVQRKHYYRVYNSAKIGRVSRDKKETIIKTKRSLLRVMRGGKWETLYRMRASVDIQKNPFIEPAGNASAEKIPEFFRKQAEKRLK